MTKNVASYIPEDDPDLDLPHLTGRQFEDATVTAVRTISTDFKTDVVFAGNQAATNNDKVFLPSNPPDERLTRRQVYVGRGYADHESLHKRLTDFKSALPKFKEWADSGKLLTNHMAQAIEDVRIEHGGTHLYHGISKSIDKTAEHVCRKFVEEHLVESPELAEQMPVVIALAVTWAGRIRLGYPSSTIKGAFNAMSDDVKAKAEKIVDAVMTLPHGVTGVGQVDQDEAFRGCRMGLELAERFAKEVEEEQKEKEKEEPEDDGRVNKRRGEEPGEPGEPGEPSESGEPEGTSESEDEDEPEGGERRGGGMGAGEERPPSGEDGEPVSFDPNLDHYVRDLMTPGEASTAYRPFSRSEDQWWTRDGDNRMTEIAKHHGLKRYNDSRKHIASNVATMRRKLERALMAKDNRDFEGGRSGQLDVRRRATNIVLGNEIVFRKRIEGEAINTAVTILIDLSGSMAGPKLRMAQMAAIAISEALNTSVPFEVLGFSTAEPSQDLYQAHYRAKSEWAVDDSFNIMYRKGKDGEREVVSNPDRQFFDRVEPLVMVEFKPFSLPLLQCRATMGTIGSLSLRNNIDGESVIAAALRLAQRPEDKKILLVLSDGAPAYLVDDDRPSPEQRTRDAVELVEAMGIRTIGVGIMDRSVRHFYPRHVVLQDVTELGKTVLDEIAKQIMGEHFHVDNADLLGTSLERKRAMR